eukprot:Gregarina_sp_Pseudo_9__5143@NODE_542_length_2604_cov_19_042495_g512_i0_p1_GENE_NODE_542_length_2604_cov_19_042495_g512_i0NODE_542_length_2604_cov_19_042495_g512_i0_p1_ORF_typecomplete_len476_score64_80_NODE_542_length_2604_cov_19_042495_g512_i010942521
MEDIIAANTGILFVLLEFLSLKERWHFKDVSRECRQAVLSARHERVCMMECLKMTHGYWNEEAARLRCPKIPKVTTWVQFQLHLEHEMCHHDYRAPDTFEFGKFQWVRIQDHHLDKLNHSLKYFCPAWNSGCQDDQMDQFHQDLAVYKLAVSPEDKDAGRRFLKTVETSSLTSVATSLHFGHDAWSWEENDDDDFQPGDAMRLLYAPPETAYDYIKEWVCGEEVERCVEEEWEEPSSDDDEDEFPSSYLVPLSIASLFIIRVLLQNRDLVARLTDINDPLTPPLFLNTICDAKIYNAEKVVLWDINIREALNKHNAVFTLNPATFWDNVFDLEVGSHSCPSTPKKRKKLKKFEPPHIPTNKPFELATWLQIIRCVTRHEKAKLKEVHRYILSRYAKELAPFNMRVLSKTDIVPDCSEEVGDPEKCHTAVVEFVLSDADDGPNPKMAVDTHMGDQTVMFVGGANSALLFKRTGTRN